jgi:hypothetical protein
MASRSIRLAFSEKFSDDELVAPHPNMKSAEECFAEVCPIALALRSWILAPLFVQGEIKLAIIALYWLYDSHPRLMVDAACR